MRPRASHGLGSVRGFTLLEVVVAIGLVATAAIGVAQLSGLAVAVTAAARDMTAASLLASAKAEQLLALQWAYTTDVSGALVPVSDSTTDLSVVPASAGGPGVSVSPPGTLFANRPPYVDYLDASGTWVGTGTAPPPGSRYIRRWAIVHGPRDLLVVQVMVTTVAVERRIAGTRPSGRLPGEAWVIAARARVGP